MAIKSVSAATLKEWRTAGDVLILDVRESFEFRRAHIPGATLQTLRKIDTFDPARLSDTDKRGKIVLVCASGQRSAAGCRALAPHGLPLYNLTGGMAAWRAAGGEIAGSATAPGTAERMRQLAFGALALAGFLLGHGLNAQFHLLSGLAGVGLVFGALSATKE